MNQYFTEADNGYIEISKTQLRSIISDFDLDVKQVARLAFATPRAASSWYYGERVLSGSQALVLLARLGIKPLQPHKEVK